MTNTTNPFLAGIPLVTIVTATRQDGATATETPYGDCTRVWSRVRSSARLGNTAELLPDATYKGRMSPRAYDFTNMDQAFAIGTASTLMHFDDTNGVQYFLDQTGKPWTGAGYNPVISSAQFKYGISSLNLTQGSYIQTPNHADFDLSSGPWTVELWIYPLVAGEQWILSKDGGYSYGLEMDSQSRLVGYIGDGATQRQFITGAAVPLNTWSHIAMTRTGTNLQIFLNGVPTTTIATLKQGTGSGPLLLGSGGPGLTFFTGYIDEFRIVKDRAIYVKPFLPFGPNPPYTPDQTKETTCILAMHGNSLTDQSGAFQAVTGVTTGSLISSSELHFGLPSFEFYGNHSNYIEVLSNPILSLDIAPYCGTVECWIKPNSYPKATPAYILSKGNTGAYALALTANGNIQVTISGTLFTGTAVIPANQWTHVSMSIDGTTVRSFINGVPDISAAQPALVTDTSNLTIGGLTGSVNDADYFNGYVSELQVHRFTRIRAFSPVMQSFRKFADASWLSVARLLPLNGNTADVSVNASPTLSFNGTFTSANPVFPGVQSAALSNNQYISLTADATLAFGRNSSTLEMWIYPDSAIPNGSIAVLADFRPSATEGLYPTLYLDSSNLLHFYTNGASQITASVPVNLNSWNHIAWVRWPRGSSYLFINGVQAASFVDSYTYIVGQAIVGVSAKDLTSGFSGQIAQLRITNGAARYLNSFDAQSTIWTTWPQQ